MSIAAPRALGQKWLRSLATTKKGWQSGRQSKARGLPLNRTLGAYNVFEVPIDPSVIDAANDIYRQHIAPRVADQEGPFESADDLAFYVKRPKGWDSDISWWSADNASAYQHFDRECFEKIRFDEELLRLIDVDTDIRMYCPFFVVRSRCEQTRFHSDYEWDAGTNGYTLMTPVQDMSSDVDGHLEYLDIRGRRRMYRYRVGTAVVFGAGFIHGTQKMLAGSPRAFLCFTFGSDKEQHWPALKKTVATWSRQVRRPGGALIRGSQPMPQSY
jgi:hypothetical protein